LSTKLASPTHVYSVSIAGIVHFTTTVDSTLAIATGADYLYILNPITTWAYAEPATRIIAANLPALGPLLDQALNFVSNLTSRINTECADRLSPSRAGNYVELGALRSDVDKDQGNEM
jgi:hypothetical protein